MRFVAGLLTGLLLRPAIKVLLAAAVVFAILGIYRAAYSPNGPIAQALTGGFPATITRAVDGDTLVADVDGRTRRIRVMGIDAPETVKPGTPVQRCGRDASRRAKAWVKKHRMVRLKADPAAPDEDRYGRLLRYVDPVDGARDLSTVQVAAGLARVKVYGQDLDRLPDLRAAQRRAKRAGRGLWGTSCS